MGSITETFTALNEVLLSDYRSRKTGPREIVASRLVRPMLPSAFRLGTGQIVDLKDRLLGPFDLIAGWEAFPPLGEGIAQQFLADGAAFCLQVRDWKEEDLTQFATMAGKLKALVRKNKKPIYCAVIGFDSLPVAQVNDFMKSSAGQAIDGVLSIGQQWVLRNSQGWYGDPQKIRMVTAKGEGESLKAFAFWLIHVAQNFLGVPSPITDYQHL